MMAEIFARLPAKTVARWHCLSRSYAATLTSASFADLHFRRANHSQRQRQQRAGTPPKLFFTTAVRRLEAWRHDSPPALRELTSAALLDLPPRQSDLDHLSRVFVTAKPCHGLVLVLRWPCHGHYVCNPCTGAVLPLPDTKTPSWMCGRDELPCSLFNRVCYGLGYDSATKEHKVVRLFYLHEEGRASAVTACEVFTIGQASAHWRPAAQRPPPCTISLFTVALAVFFSGNLHFLQNQFKGDCIVTFNVSQETFGSLMPPPGLDHVDFELAVLDGCLCLHYGLNGYSPDPNFYIWRLTSYDGEGQWEQLFRIQPQAWPDAMPQIDFNRKHRIAPLEIYYGGDGHKKIMFSTDALTVFTVDVDLDGFGAPKVLFTPPMDSFAKTSFGTHAVGLLEESLVSVGRSSEEIIFSSPSMRAWSHILKWLPTHSVVPLTRCRGAPWRTIPSNSFVWLFYKGR
jgi:F-box interacting protein